MKSKILIFLFMLVCLLSAQTTKADQDSLRKEQLKRLISKTEVITKNGQELKSLTDSLTSVLIGNKLTDTTEYISIQFTSGIMMDVKKEYYRQTNFITANILPFASHKNVSAYCQNIMLTLGYSFGNSTGTLNQTALYGATYRFSRYTGITIGCAHNIKEEKAYLYSGLAVDLKMFTVFNMLKSVLVEE